MINEDVKDRIIDFKVDVRNGLGSLVFVPEDQGVERRRRKAERVWKKEIIIWDAEAIERYQNATKKEKRHSEKKKAGKKLNDNYK